jgi:hypothetical protein
MGGEEPTLWFACSERARLASDRDAEMADARSIRLLPEEIPNVWLFVSARIVFAIASR